MGIHLTLCLLGALLSIPLILIILSRLFSKFGNHMKENWPSIIISFINVLLGSAIAISGVLWAFQKGTDREFSIQADIFKRNFAAIMSECGENKTTIDNLKKNISPTNFNLQLLSSEISNALIVNPMLYKYTGGEYMYALRSYLVKVRLANRMMDFVFDDFKTDGNIQEENIKVLKELLDNCLYYLRILQYQTQWYVYSYDVKWGPELSNVDEIMDWMNKKKKITIEELEDKIDKISRLSEKEKRGLQKMMKKVLQKDKLY